MFYRTGWRRNEVLHLTWNEVDMDAGVIRLDPDRDKTRESRIWPLRFFLAELIERRARVRIVGLPYVFDRDSHKISISKWDSTLTAACAAAGRHKYTHDCRRTAARALERAGVPRSVAMKLIGHKTEAMYQRYRIVDERDLEDAVEKLEEYYAGQAKEPKQRVVEIS